MTDQSSGSDKAMSTAEWMRRRQAEVEHGEADYARGVDACASAPSQKGAVEAATPQAVRALGASLRREGVVAPRPVPPVRRGEKAILSDEEYAGIIFNETRSFSGPSVQAAREQIAHALINADETWGPERSRYAKTASATARPAKAEEGALQSARGAVAAARAQRAKGVDSTRGAVFFRFPTTPTREPFNGRSIKTQHQVDNSFTLGDVPSTTAYVNTYW